MTTTLTLAVDRVSARAASVDWRRVLLVAAVVLPYVLFFAARLALRGVRWAAAWVWAAGMEGWEAAGPKREGSD